MPIVLGAPATGYQFSSITLDDAAGTPVALHRTANRHLYRAAGLLGVSPVRQVVRSRPSRHGSLNDSRYTEGRLIVLDGRALSTSSFAEATSEFRMIASAALETLDEGASLLKWTEDGGLALQALVKLHGELDPPVEVGPNILAYQAQFLAEDPRAYSQTLSTSTGGTLSAAPGGWAWPETPPIVFSISAGGTTAVNNQGNRPTPPVFRVYGACVNPQILLLGTTSRIALTGTVSAGNYLEIDVQNRSITLNGTSPALNFLDAANTTWFDLPKGTSTIQLLAPTFDTVARCDVLYRSAYT
jgi:hypothetical protein